MTPNIAVVRAFIETLPEWEYVDHVGITNCRPIAGSQTYSQHSWSNALDIHFTPSVAIAASGDALVAGTQMKNKILAKFEPHIYEMLWQVSGHYDHIHVSTWPKGYLTPPCAGGTQRIKYENGTVQSAPFPLTIQEEDMAGPADELTSGEVNTLKYLHGAFNGALGLTREAVIDKLVEDARSDLITRAELNAALALVGGGVKLPAEEIVKIIRSI